MISSIALFISTIDIVFAIYFCLNVSDDDEKNDEIMTVIIWINTTSLAILSIVPTVTGFLMIQRLRNRFDDIYNDYGCIIKTIMII